LRGKLNHLGLANAPAKSTASDGLRNRSHEFFEDLYFSLVKKIPVIFIGQPNFWIDVQRSVTY